MTTPSSTADAIEPRWLSNGTFHIFFTPQGTGFSAYFEHLLTSWTSDTLGNLDGNWIFIRDLDSGARWTPNVSLDASAWERTAAGFQVVSSRNGIDSTLRVELAAVLPLEERQLTLVNRTTAPRRLELTGYLEVVLNYPEAHAAHPAFSKLFVQTEALENQQILLAQRRPRSNHEQPPVMGVRLSGATLTEFETDRARFIGRGRSLARALGLETSTPLSGTEGNVLDAAFATRTTLQLAPGQSITLSWRLAAGGSRNEVLDTLQSAPAFGSPLAGSTFDAIPWRWKRYVERQPSDGRGPSRSLEASAEPATAPTTLPSTQREAEELKLFNGLGGFAEDGREYVIQLRPGAGGELNWPPMPWSNVIANERFGCLVSERGAGCVWSRNSREHRLTPWRNDPVSDPFDEALLIRDEHSGTFFSPLPGLNQKAVDFDVRHGFGYTRFESAHGTLAVSLTQFVPVDDPLRISHLRVENRSNQTRRLAIYSYHRFVLGVLPEDTAPSVQTEWSTEFEAALARNPNGGDFSDGIAFATLFTERPIAFDWTLDRGEFLGAEGRIDAPRAVAVGGALSSRGRGDGEPCAVLRLTVEVGANQAVNVFGLIGETTSLNDLSMLLRLYRSPESLAKSWHEVRAYWSEVLDHVRIETPEPAIDLMINGWAVYQTLTCRIWARTAYYQSGGAYGFRDQLQDAASLALLQPNLARAQILLHAEHQFLEGDVLHWWHPPKSRGIRTRFADDLVWLPYLTSYYIHCTGDESVLSESARFLKARLLEPGEDETYLEPEDSREHADIYEHCCRALDRSLTTGAHGLPLFGTGDWNDGMNRVGREGKGESVWMGFFLYAAIGTFLPFCEARGDTPRISGYTKYREHLAAALNDTGWDGQWYRRAYYDDGTPLGSAQNDECRIDALAQAWAVISGVAPSDRVARIMDALEEHLISDKDRLVRLLAPPFVDTDHDPGYIKGYVAGVRENGGQYTHAAMWVVRAMAEAGRRDRAAPLLAMLSPLSHTATPLDIERYKVEPYVIAADVYGVAPHIGRGGWTWYTGSAGWFYRVALESILGISKEGSRALRISPRIPDAWSGFYVEYKDRGNSVLYRIQVQNPQRQAHCVVSASIDGAPLPIDAGTAVITLGGASEKGESRKVEVILGPA